jgi:hypothetical protein
MAFELSIHGAKKVSPGVWQVQVEPAHVRLLGSTPPSVGDVTVLLLTAEPSFNPESRVLSFGPGNVRVLNVGATEAAVVVLGSSNGALATPSPLPPPVPAPIGNGDSLFLQHLSPELRELGVALLESVRKQFPGSLVFHPRSEKFVESPDNFWTVRIQRRDKSLRITVRGTPQGFSGTRLIELKPDMGTYSAFKVSALRQIPEALQIIREASSR